MMWRRALTLMALACATLVISALLLVAPARAQGGSVIALPATQLVDGRVLEPAHFKGKAVLVLMWATRCPNCLASLPQHARLYEAYREQGFELLALSVDEDAADVRDFLAANPYDFPVAMRTAAHRAVLGSIIGTPTLVLLARDGRVAWRHLGEASYDEIELQLQSALEP